MSRAIIIATMLSLAVPAAAKEKMVVDMGKLTCAELTKLGFQDFASITMWMADITMRASAARSSISMSLRELPRR